MEEDQTEAALAALQAKSDQQSLDHSAKSVAQEATIAKLTTSYAQQQVQLEALKAKYDEQSRQLDAFRDEADARADAVI